MDKKRNNKIGTCIRRIFHFVIVYPIHQMSEGVLFEKLLKMRLIWELTTRNFFEIFEYTKYL
jgi:hypothetical protein